jgi:hypothetical protein
MLGAAAASGADFNWAEVQGAIPAMTSRNAQADEA